MPGSEDGTDEGTDEGADGTDLETLLLFQRVQAHMSELQLMLALLVVRHGYETDIGWRYDLSDGAAHTLRAQLADHQPTVSVTFEDGLHVIDAT